MTGSSPLARGLQRDAQRLEQERRIIPARAGFTPPPRMASGRCPDHPRSRGVYSWATSGRTARTGSSPLARGLPSTAAERSGRRRIIPARAGFTCHHGCLCVQSEDHPRSCGVYAGRLGSPRGRPGSSPLARGLRARRGRVPRRRRIIPARAGFTRIHDVLVAIVNGSSPLARGLRRHYFVNLNHRRIIPARAGFTSRRSRPSRSKGDHPRSRGVYLPGWAAEALAEGSSPLARGLLPHTHPPRG